MNDEILEELMDEWSVGNCAGVVDSILSQDSPDKIAIYAIAIAFAVKKASRNSNQADIFHLVDLLEN